MALRTSPHERTPASVVRYAHGLALSVTHNVPAYGFSVVVTAGVLVDTADLHRPTVVHALLYLLGATVAFALVGGLAALVLEEKNVEDATPQVMFIGSVFSFVSPAPVSEPLFSRRIPCAAGTAGS